MPEGFRVWGKGKTYRAVSHEADGTDLHYEFLLDQGQIGVEIHLESEAVRPLGLHLQTLEQNPPGGLSGPLLWDPMWSRKRGRLRRVFAGDPPVEAVAREMALLIDGTWDGIAARRGSLRASSRS